MWMASSGVHAIFDGIEVQMGSSLPWWRKRVHALLACFVLSIGVAVMAALLTGAETLASWAHVSLLHGAGRTEKVIARVVQLVVGGALAVALVAGLYRLAVPVAARHPTQILPGAVFAVAAHAMLGLGYGFVVRLTGTGGAYQAGLALVGVTLTSLYLSSLALLLGAEINHQLAARRRRSIVREG
jgi:membrane protein